MYLLVQILCSNGTPLKAKSLGSSSNTSFDNKGANDGSHYETALFFAAFSLFCDRCFFCSV